MRVILAGPIPPPHGGVSVHVERLRTRLLQEGASVEVRNEQQPGEGFFTFLRRIGIVGLGEFKGILHCHIHNPWTLAAAGLRSRLGGTVVVTVHNPRTPGSFSKMPLHRRLLLRKALQGVKHWIAVSDEVCSSLIALGVEPSRVHVIPAYLSPPLDEWRATSLPIGVRAVLDAWDHCIVMSAFHLRSEGGGNIYGVESVIPLLQRLEKDHLSAGLAVFVAQMGPEVDSLVAEIEALGLSHRFCLVGDSTPLGPTLTRASLYLRPTRSDGDSVSVREALDSNVSVLASDVCERPPGVETYAFGKEEDLYARVCELLENREQPSPDVDAGGEAAFQAILKVYQQARKSDGR